MREENEKRGRVKKPVARHVDPDGNRENPNDAAEERHSGMIEGRNACLEALRAGVVIDKLFISKGETDSALGHIVSLSRKAGAVISEVDKRKLDAMSKTHAHQGVIAKAAVSEYAEISDILETAKRKNENPLIILCDELSDPHNLGAIIRTAEVCGAHGVVITKHRSAGLTPIVAKASAGAVYHMAIARATNLSAAIAELKKSGVWVFCASAEGQVPLWQCDFIGATALVIGSEGKGVGKLVAKNCDHTVKIPMFGKVSSLNASVSSAVLMYEAIRQRTNCTTK
jgi:23S rRNA (guanosine2251-2'-O)-methyltransferase